MGIKLLTVQLLTHLMNVSEPANSANRRGLIERVSRGQIVYWQHRCKCSILVRASAVVSQLNTLERFVKNFLTVAEVNTL